MEPDFHKPQLLTNGLSVPKNKSICRNVYHTENIYNAEKMESNPVSTKKALIYDTHNHTQDVSGFQRATPDPIWSVTQ